MTTYFIIIPELILTGPTKGSIALANGLISYGKKVYLISLKENNYHLNDLKINKNVNVLTLNGNLLSKLRQFKYYFKKFKPNFRISIGFSSDLINFSIFSLDSIKVSSVRGNLFINYELDFGLKGKLLAYIHYYIISKFDVVLSMTNSMKQFLKKKKIESIIIGNFIDEKSLLPIRENSKNNNVIKFLFLGSLSVRKNIFFMIDSFLKLSEKRNDVELIIVGDGPLKKSIEAKVNLSSKKITLLGFKNNPYEELNKSNVIVLLSKSEGMSRAVLEAMFFGNIAILSDVDGNRELIEDGKNGFLYNSDKSDILSLFEKSYVFCKTQNLLKKNYIPPNFRQDSQIKKLILILENGR